MPLVGTPIGNGSVPAKTTHQRFVRTTVGVTTTVLAAVTNIAGQFLGSGTVSGTLTKLFGDHSSTTLTDEDNITATWHSPVKGTASNPDGRWSPGIDGVAGFNLEVEFSADLFTAFGQYRAVLQVVSGGKTYKITVIFNVASG